MIITPILVAGGSTVAGWNTSTSDTDFFVIYGNEEELKLPLNIIPKNSDVEKIHINRVAEIYSQLKKYQPQINGIFPPFDYFEMRFISRFLLGKMIFGNENSFQSFRDKISTPLNTVLNSMFVSEWINCYQDYYGLINASRFVEAHLLSSNLINHAFRISASIKGIIEPSLKWSYKNYTSNSQNKTTIANTIVNYSKSISSTEIAHNFLLQLNSLIISEKVKSELNKEFISSFNSFLNAKFCFTGLLHNDAFFDVTDNSFAFPNKHYLRLYVDHEKPFV